MAESRSINRKLTAVTKGTSESSLNRIEVAHHECYLSEQTNDLLHHEDGNFAAHPKAEDGQYHAHHSQKILPKDAEPVEVLKEKDKGGLLRVIRRYQWYQDTEKRRLFHHIGNKGETLQRRGKDGYFITQPIHPSVM